MKRFCIKPRNPSRKPITVMPWVRIAALPNPRMAAFNPGESPPAVSIPICLLMVCLQLLARRSYAVGLRRWRGRQAVPANTRCSATSLQGMDDNAQSRLEVIAGSLGIGKLDRHILLCAEQSTPRCSGYEESSQVWAYLKRRLKELDLASAPPGWRGRDVEEPPGPVAKPGGSILRTKVDCLRVCERGRLRWSTRTGFGITRST